MFAPLDAGKAKLSCAELWHRLAFGGEIAGGLGGAQQGGQSAKQRLDFLGIEDCRLDLQKRPGRRHQCAIRLERVLVLGGGGGGQVGFYFCLSSRLRFFGGIGCHLIASCYYSLRSTFAGCSERTLP
jgi:hypothetical protein